MRRAMGGRERRGTCIGPPPVCALGLARSGVYCEPPSAIAEDPTLMRCIDKILLELRFYGSRRMALLNARMAAARSEAVVSRHWVQRLMRTMGLEALLPRSTLCQPK